MTGTFYSLGHLSIRFGKCFHGGAHYLVKSLEHVVSMSHTFLISSFFWSFSHFCGRNWVQLALKSSSPLLLSHTKKVARGAFQSVVVCCLSLYRNRNQEGIPIGTKARWYGWQDVVDRDILRNQDAEIRIKRSMNDPPFLTKASHSCCTFIEDVIICGCFSLWRCYCQQSRHGDGRLHWTGCLCTFLFHDGHFLVSRISS